MTALEVPQIDRTRLLVLLAVGGLGASAVITQLTLMRELLGAFSGNELVLGISLGSWLLLTGIGTWGGRLSDRFTDPGRVLATGLLCAALLPLAQVCTVRGLRDVIFLHGAVVSVTETVLGSLALLMPFCLISGGLLTLACHVLALDGGPASTGLVYFADAAGSIVGGVLFSFALVPWFDHFALLYFPAMLNLLLASLLARTFHAKFLFSATGFSAIVLTGLVLHANIDELTTQWQHFGQRIIFRANSPYGRLVVTSDAGQLTFFENGKPVTSTHNIDQVEETVHYAMIQRPDARRVLLISGGVTGVAREILRYGVEEVTYVELDPLIIEAGRRFLPENLADPRIKAVATDGRHFVQHTIERYDVVIIALPDPSTSLLNRFFTAEFFGEIRRLLTEDGVLAFGLGHYENYVSLELAKLLSSAYRTLQQSYDHVCMIPGGRVFFLASTGPLSLEIAARLDQRGIFNKLVNRHYLDAMLTSDRLADLDRAVSQPAQLNTDFDPTIYYYILQHWLSQFPTHGGGFLGVCMLAGAGIYFISLRAVPRVIFASGFAASVLEVVLLLGFQTLYGSVYQQVGLVVTIFMAGLAIGAWLANRRLAKYFARPRSPEQSPRMLSWFAWAIAAFAILLPLILSHLEYLNKATGSDYAGRGTILVLTLLLAAVVGGLFPLAGMIEPGKTTVSAPRLYTADFFGAALGALLASTLLIPLVGMTAVCLITAALNLMTGALVLYKGSAA